MIKREWAIYGIPKYYLDGPGPEEVVATFDTRGEALTYISRSRLKRKRWMRYWKYKSLLCGYEEIVRVDGYEVRHPPHNPRINWK